MKEQYFTEYFDESSQVMNSLKNLSPIMKKAADLILDAVIAGNKILWMGNGGSASDAQHLSAELVGRFEINRRPIASVALNTDTSTLTAIGNDFGFEQIFLRQVQALCQKGDICIGISTSGRSKNVLLALKEARLLGAHTIAFAGEYLEELQEVAEIILAVDGTTRTCHIQEAHIAIGQAICGYIEYGTIDLVRS